MKHTKLAICLLVFLLIFNICTIGRDRSILSTIAAEAGQTTNPKNPVADMTHRDFAVRCGTQTKHEIFEKTCKGKRVLLEGVIAEADSSNEVRIDIGDEAPWDVELDKSTPRYKQGTRVKFYATLDEQMGWGAHMKNGHFWAVLSATSTTKKKQKDGSVSTGPDAKNGKPTEDFTGCLLAQARNDKRNQLSSYDGGTSAMKLMVQCKATWYAYLDKCIQETHKTEGDCNVQAAILAQSALKLLGK